MRIILAHNYFNPIGGAEVFYHEVGRVLEENGHEVAYFSPLDENIDSPWSQYFPKAADYKKTNLISNVLSFKDMIYSKESKNKFKELIRDFKPDIVHVFAIYIRLTPSILDACTEMGIPVVMSCNDYKHICPNYKLFQGGQICEQCKGGKFYNAVKNKCSKNSIKYSVASALEAYSHKRRDIYKKNISTFLFASEFMAKKTEEFWGSDNFEWDVLKNPFESKKFHYSEVHEDFILFFGRLIDEKGVNILIESMKLNPDIKLKIIGTGPDEIILQQLSNKLNLDNVEFLGAKWDEALNDELRKCKFVIVPSIWHENFPYVIIQSFAYGKAVIGTNRGGIPELVRDNEFGFIYDALDQKDLAKKIRVLYDNVDLCKKMGKAAKVYLDENFNDDVFYQEINRIYSKILK